MTTAALLDDLAALGVTLVADGDRLRYSPRSAVTGELLQRLRTCKAELLRLLASGAQGGDAGPVTTGPTVTDRPAGDSPQALPGGDRHGTDPARGDAGQDMQPQDGDAAGWLEVTDPDGRRCWVRADAAELQVIDLPTPCPTCNGLDCWQDAAGGLHCATCSPAKPTGQRLKQRAAELRERYPVARGADLEPQPATVPRTWPAAVPSGIVAAPVPTCSDCGRPRSVVPGQSGRPAGLCFDCWSKRP